MKIVVGIGNPGKRYAGTRHNVGYRVIEKLADRLDATTAGERFDALVQEAFADGDKLLLLRPLTYVNFSGRAVRRAVGRLSLPERECGLKHNLIVICDDMNLPLARVRVRRSGGSGGHNGLQSIIEHLGTTEFPRIRIGIGSPQPFMDGADYVLGRFRDEEEPLIDQACDEAARAVMTWAGQGIDECMNAHNRPMQRGADNACGQGNARENQD